jgi:hypothetical protein
LAVGTRTSGRNKGAAAVGWTVVQYLPTGGGGWGAWRWRPARHADAGRGCPRFSRHPAGAGHPSILRAARGRQADRQRLPVGGDLHDPSVPATRPPHLAFGLHLPAGVRAWQRRGTAPSLSLLPPGRQRRALGPPASQRNYAAKEEKRNGFPLSIPSLQRQLTIWDGNRRPSA